MADAFLAFIAKTEADFRAALDNLARARKVYASFKAQTNDKIIDVGGQSLRGDADSPSEPSTPAARAVNADLPLRREPVHKTGQGERIGTYSETARHDTAPGDGERDGLAKGRADNDAIPDLSSGSTEGRARAEGPPLDIDPGPMPEFLRRARA